MQLRKEINDQVICCFQMGVSHISGARLTSEERSEIQKRGIEIYVSAVYMDGTADYSFYDRSRQWKKS